MTAGRHVRLYQSVRTAHLERAHEQPPATILYKERRYDFDADLARGLDIHPAAGLTAALRLWRDPADVLEVNEPLMLEASIWTAVTLAAVRIRSLVGRRPTRVVTYAIENRNPWTGKQPYTWKGRVRRFLEGRASAFIWRRLDRVAFGTQASEELYRQVLGPNKADTTLIWALPTPATDAVGKQPGTACFVSAFSPRKGVDLLLAAWPAVRDRLPHARLHMIGKGALTDSVVSAASADPSITVSIDPPRADVHAALASSSVLVLPSQRTPTWREQVGLPIVEGLSHGCTVVTTSETGLAAWLAGHGHAVIDQGGTAEQLGEALATALGSPIQPEVVVAELPARDGRLAADDWMMAPGGSR